MAVQAWPTYAPLGGGALAARQVFMRVWMHQRMMAVVMMGRGVWR